MSTYVYLTAEHKINNKWKLITPLEKHTDWGGKLTPPLIIDGGWPKLANKITTKTKNFGVPENASIEFNTFYKEVLKNDWPIGWAMYKDLKNIEVSDGINNSKTIRLRYFFKNISINKDNLRLIYWWS